MSRVVALLVVGLMAAACAGSGEAVVEGASASSSTVVEAEVAVGEPVSGETVLSCLPMDPTGWWRSDDLFGKIDDAWSRLAANDEVIVASSPGSYLPAVLYSSPNGLAWEESVAFSELLMGLRDGSVAGGGKGFVAVGTTDSEDTEYGLFATPMVAFSQDGSRWERVDSDALPGPQVRWFSDVFAGPDGFLAVGSDKEEGWENPVFVWFSDDGMTWSKTDLPAGEQDAVAVTVTDAGWAMVSVADAFGEPQVHVWTSADGRQWSEVDTDSVPPGHAVLAYSGTAPLVSNDDMWMLALVGATDDSPEQRTPTVWISTDDGKTWEEVTVWDDPDQAGFQVLDLVVTDHGFLLAGYQDRAGRPGTHFVHYSEDGRTWHHCWTGAQEVTSIEVFGESVVLLGSGQTFVWREP